MIGERFRRHRYAEIILSLPGFGVILGAEFLAATGGNMSAFDSADRLAGICGLAPVPRDSGRISATSNAPASITDDSCAPAILPLKVPPAPTPLPGPTKAANVLRANTTDKRSWPWPGDASTSCGPCCATTPPTKPQPPQRLDKPIENRSRRVPPVLRAGGEGVWDMGSPDRLGRSGLFGTFRAYGAYGSTVEADDAAAQTGPGSTVGWTCGRGRRCGHWRHDERSCRHSRCAWQLVVAHTIKSERENNCSRATEQRECSSDFSFH
ncbi:transposase [Mycobacterium lentiflavum]|uniref:Transposase n=1 Tax=Mycobacterium lentiflavum TaxID=141349 RepID=A0A0E4CRI7_MYCLN|nr:transposase [Mycobacterium lentiflavum]